MDRSSRVADRIPDTNRLLSALGRKDRVHVLAECEPVKLKVRDVLWEPGQRIRHVYFPLDGFVSQLVPVHGRDNLEVALVGNMDLLDGRGRRSDLVPQTKFTNTCDRAGRQH